MARGLYGAKAWVRGWQGSFPYGRQRLALCASVAVASAGQCPGNPDALGTSRTIVVDPREHIRIGTMDYAETLPLRRPGSRAHLRRRPDPALHRQGARHPRRRMRQGDLFHRRHHGKGISGAGAARLRRGPHHRHAQHDAIRSASGRCRSSAPMPRSTMASRRPRPLWATRTGSRRFSGFRALATPGPPTNTPPRAD